MPIAYKIDGGTSKLLTKDGHLCSTCCCEPYILRSIELPDTTTIVYFTDLEGTGVVTGKGSYWKLRVWSYYYNHWAATYGVASIPSDKSLGRPNDQGGNYDTLFSAPNWRYYAGQAMNIGAGRMEFLISCDGVTWS
jgi:hypothetical protein